MYVTVDVETGDVSLVEPGVFTAFHVEARPLDAPTAAVVSALGADGAAADDDPDDDHAYVSVAAIRRWAAPASATWETEFVEMVRYATTKGWCNDDGSMIRAHIRRSTITD